MNRPLFAAALLSLAMTSQSFAASRCKEWVRQPNGSQMRNCIGDLGKSYCESCTAVAVFVSHFGDPSFARSSRLCEPTPITEASST